MSRLLDGRAQPAFNEIESPTFKGGARKPTDRNPSRRPSEEICPAYTSPCTNAMVPRREQSQTAAVISCQATRYRVAREFRNRYSPVQDEALDIQCGRA